MHNALAVYTTKRAISGRKLQQIAEANDFLIRLVSLGGYIPGEGQAVYKKSLVVRGGMIVVGFCIAQEKKLLGEFDDAISAHDQSSVTKQLKDGKLPWCELYPNKFDYADSQPKLKETLDASVSSEQLPELQAAKIRYLIYNQSRRKNGDRLMRQLTEALADAVDGLIADYQRPPR